MEGLAWRQKAGKLSSEIAQVLRFTGDWVCSGKALLIVGHFPMCVKSHVPLPMIWPVSICRTFQGKVHDNQLCVSALHTQSPVKRRTSTISEESWPAFRCRCAMWGDKSLTARKRIASFPCVLQGSLRMARSTHETAFPFKQHF